MSLATREVSWLSLAPRVSIDRSSLRIRTNALLEVLSLGASCTEAVIDSRRRRIDVRRRRFWRTSFRSYRFSEVDHVSYNHADLGTSWIASASLRGGVQAGRADTVERFCLGLVMKDGERVPIATFRGEGARTTGLMGVALGDDVLDFHGSQERDSRALVEQVLARLQVRLGPALLAEERGAELTQQCPSCGQRTSINRADCLYCGARLAGGSPASELS